MALNPTQQKVARKLIKRGKASGATKKDILTALVTGLTEASLENPSGGHGTSAGWRQETSGYGSVENRTNIRRSADRFYRELKGIGQGGSIGSRAQAVQRSAFPGRYATHTDEAKSILRALNKNIGGSKTKSKTKESKSSSTVVPGLSAQEKLDFVRSEDKSASDYLGFIQSRDAATQTTKTKKETKSTKTKMKDREGTVSPGKVDVVSIGKLAQKMGLSVGENSHFGGVDPVHTSGSYHYRDRAIDVSGDTQKMKKFAKKVDRLYGPKLAELFWNGAGARNRKNGASVGKGFVSGHTDHVHVAV